MLLQKLSRHPIKKTIMIEPAKLVGWHKATNYWPEIGHFEIWLLHEHAYSITAWEKPALKCDWFFNFAYQGDHFTILTGLAHSRLKTLHKWIEANVSDVLLTCWANNFHHQQFYLAVLVPTVKLTMHSISIRQRKWSLLSMCEECTNLAEVCKETKTTEFEGKLAFLLSLRSSFDWWTLEIIICIICLTCCE